MGTRTHPSTGDDPDRPLAAAAVEAELAAAGVVAVAEEAAELIAAARGDAVRLAELVDRRRGGEPVAWLSGRSPFCGLSLVCLPGVYVPRWQSEPLAERAAARLPARGTAVDVATGGGAVAAVLGQRRPGARVVASEVDHRAARCAAANGVRVVRGDLVAPFLGPLDGEVDVLTAILPYVPTGELPFLPRDTLTHEAVRSYDGGRDGCGPVRRLLPGAARLLRAGGTLLIEVGGDQPDLLAEDLVRHDLDLLAVLADSDGDVRGLEAVRR